MASQCYSKPTAFTILILAGDPFLKIEAKVCLFSLKKAVFTNIDRKYHVPEKMLSGAEF